MITFLPSQDLFCSELTYSPLRRRVFNYKSERWESIDSSLILFEDGGATVFESTPLGRESVTPHECKDTHIDTHKN